MSTYEEIQKAALALDENEQDRLLDALSLKHVERKANALAEKVNGWKRAALKVLAWAAAVAATAGGAFWLSSCTYTSSQVGADGSTAQRVFAVDAATARDLVRLYGVPQIPVVTTK